MGTFLSLTFMIRVREKEMVIKLSVMSLINSKTCHYIFYSLCSECALVRCSRATVLKHYYFAKQDTYILLTFVVGTKTKFRIPAILGIAHEMTGF